MKVRCTTNSLCGISDQQLRERISDSVRQDGPINGLVVGEIYPVVALLRWRDRGLRVYLHTIEESDHPYPFPLEMFETVDPALPSGWVVSVERCEGGVELAQLGPAEWDNGFYERLVDGDESAISEYEVIRRRIEEL